MPKLLSRFLDPMVASSPILPDSQAMTFNSGLQKDSDELCQFTVRVWRMAILAFQPL